MKQCANCKTIMADNVTFCPKCGTPSAVAPTEPPAPATPPVTPATPAIPPAPAGASAPVTLPLNGPSSGVNGFGAIASRPTPTPAPTPASSIDSVTPADLVDPLVASKTTPSMPGSEPITPDSKPIIPDSEPITPDTPPTPIKDKKPVLSKGLKMNKRTMILIGIIAVLLIGVAVVLLMFVLPSGSNNGTTSDNTPVAPAVEEPASAANKALLSGYSFEIPSEYTMELFTDINGSPALQIATSGNDWVMDLTYLSSTLFTTVSAEGALDNEMMLLNAQTGSEAVNGQANIAGLDIYYITTNYNNVPATIFYAPVPALEGAEACTFAGIIVSSGGESGEAVLDQAGDILASAEISNISPLAEIADGTDFSGLISILGQGFNPVVEEPATE
ncbi:zinc ribbon domain-containing protein [Candidatus Saccharibacteria bacterium]|nr:zinc ribbon domain-containing protein [Candidatus Saccharibacteria bacterium]